MDHDIRLALMPGTQIPGTPSIVRPGTKLKKRMGNLLAKRTNAFQQRDWDESSTFCALRTSDKFAKLNKFVTHRGGWITSIPGAPGNFN
jgi:hypothetical protein